MSNCKCVKVKGLEDACRELADAVIAAESILRNDMFDRRVSHAVAELENVSDIAMDHMTDPAPYEA